MAETSLLAFDLAEVARALLEKQGITEGRWTLGFEFAFTAMVAGPKPEDARPCAMVLVNKVNLARADDGVPSHLLVDLNVQQSITKASAAIKSARKRKAA